MIDSIGMLVVFEEDELAHVLAGHLDGFFMFLLLLLLLLILLIENTILRRLLRLLLLLEALLRIRIRSLGLLAVQKIEGFRV